MPKPKQKYCWYHQTFHPVEAFAENQNKPDGLQTECRKAQAERRGKVGKTILRIGLGVAIAMAIHSLFAGILGIVGSISGAMPWNWFSDAGADPGDDWTVVPVDPVPIDYPEDIPPGDIIEEPIEPNPYEISDQEPDIAIGYGKDWSAS